jgi:Resolvase, N terminal domain
MLVGYMRVSSDGDRQVLDLQRDALLAAGVDERHLFEDHASGSRDDRAGLAAALAFLRPGDCLVVWKLDRLGRSLPHLLAVINDLKARDVAFRSLTEAMDTTPRRRVSCCSTSSARWRSSNAPSPGRGSGPALRPRADAAGTAADPPRSAPRSSRRWSPPSRAAPARPRSAGLSASGAAP